MTGTTPTNVLDVTVIDSNRAPWDLFVVPQTGAEIPSKALIADPDTGMQVFKMRYPAGFVNKWHTHSHAHGMYVLDGVLHTHQGDHGLAASTEDRSAGAGEPLRAPPELRTQGAVVETRPRLAILRSHPSSMDAQPMTRNPAMIRVASPAQNQGAPGRLVI